MSKRLEPIDEYERMEPDRKRRYWHRQRMKYVMALGGECEICQSVDLLELHHIHGHDLPPGRPSAARIRDWRVQYENNNLSLLCQTCHNKITRMGYK